MRAAKYSSTQTGSNFTALGASPPSSCSRPAPSSSLDAPERRLTMSPHRFKAPISTTYGNAALELTLDHVLSVNSLRRSPHLTACAPIWSPVAAFAYSRTHGLAVTEMSRSYCSFAVPGPAASSHLSRAFSTESGKSLDARFGSVDGLT